MAPGEVSDEVRPVWPPKLAVNERELFEMLGLNDGRSLRAKKTAVYRFLTQHEIKTFPGRVWPLRKIEAALAE